MENSSENIFDNNDSFFELRIDDITQTHLTSIAKWNRFLAIVGIVGSILIILLIVFGGSLLISNFSKLSDRGYNAYSSGAFTGVIILYIIFIIIYLIPCFFRLNFSNKMLKALSSKDQELLDESFAQLKTYSIYWGVLTIILIAFYTLIFIVFLIGTAMK